MSSFKPPRKTAWQVKPGADGTYLIRCRHGNEKTNHGLAFALHLWAVSHGTAEPFPMPTPENPNKRSQP